MISDSRTRREQILNSAAELERYAAKPRWDELSCFRIERELLTGMIAIRRLLEAEQSSSLLPTESIPVQTLKSPVSMAKGLSAGPLWRIADSRSAVPDHLPVHQLCEDVIHADVLNTVNEAAYEPVVVWATRKHRAPFNVSSVTLTQVITLFRRVGSEELVHTSRHAGRPVRLSQHDLVDAGLAAYAPYPFVAAMKLPWTALLGAFPNLHTQPYDDDAKSRTQQALGPGGNQVNDLSGSRR